MSKKKDKCCKKYKDGKACKNCPKARIGTL